MKNNSPIYEALYFYVEIEFYNCTKHYIFFYKNWFIFLSLYDIVKYFFYTNKVLHIKIPFIFKNWYIGRIKNNLKYLFITNKFDKINNYKLHKNMHA